MRMIRWLLLYVDPAEQGYLEYEMPYGRVIVCVAAMLLLWLTLLSIVSAVE